ncbi:MAG: B12-binding domain-containing radical SAM protein [Candidatus Omnitrophica bacterium]|nr:B12-binding domain-containing radical SAM protein [Candidatus Omnitrophota bacterium]
MDILFVNLGKENLGIEYLSAVLRQNGFITELANDPGLFSRHDNVLHIPSLARFFSRKEKILEKIYKKKPPVVAFSVYTQTYGWALDIAEKIKSVLEVVIIFGGIHATLVPAEVMKNRFIDFVIQGEGEYALLALMQNLRRGLPKGHIPGLWWREQGSVRHNPPVLIDDLDALPLPDRALFEPEVCLHADYMILASRGCPLSCAYCWESYAKKLYGAQHYRRRSVPAVIQELMIMKKRYAYRTVMFFDDVLFTDSDWLRKLLDEYKKCIAVPFRCFGHVQYFTRQIGCLLKDAGCYGIDFGVQTLNERIRRKMLNRHETNVQINTAFSICDDVGLHYDVDFLFGIPGIDEKDYVEVLTFMKQRKYLNRLKCYNLTLYPNMPFAKNCLRQSMMSAPDQQALLTGKIGDWYHEFFETDVVRMRQKKLFQKLFKLYGMLPCSARRFLVSPRMYRLFRFVPNSVVIILQLCDGMRKQDHRFTLQIKYYLFHIRRWVARGSARAIAMFQRPR